MAKGQMRSNKEKKKPKQDKKDKGGRRPRRSPPIKARPSRAAKSKPRTPRRRYAGGATSASSGLLLRLSASATKPCAFISSTKLRR